MCKNQTKQCSAEVEHLLTFFRPNIADELHLAAPDIKGVQHAVRVSRRGVREDILVSALLSTQTGNKVLPYSDQNCSIEQYKVVAVLDNQCQQERKEGQGNSRRHHPNRNHIQVQKRICLDCFYPLR